MITFTTNWIKGLAIAVALAASNPASAQNGGGINFNFGGGKNNHSNNNHHKHANPKHSCHGVNPGDTWSSISQQEYGTPNFRKQIAAFNGVTISHQLQVGQQIHLPVIHPNGKLTKSNAPGCGGVGPAGDVEAGPAEGNGGGTGGGTPSPGTPGTGTPGGSTGGGKDIGGGTTPVIKDEYNNFMYVTDGSVFSTSPPADNSWTKARLQMGSPAGVIRLEAQVLERTNGIVRIQLPELKLPHPQGRVCMLQLVRPDGNLAKDIALGIMARRGIADFGPLKTKTAGKVIAAAGKFITPTDHVNGEFSTVTDGSMVFTSLPADGSWSKVTLRMDEKPVGQAGVVIALPVKVLRSKEMVTIWLPDLHLPPGYARSASVQFVHHVDKIARQECSLVIMGR